MLKRLFSILTALLLVTGFVVPSAQALLADLGDPITPHGYPAWYQDSNGLQLELCVPAPAGNATRADLCIGDPIDPLHPLVMTGEGFYWMAFASIPLATGGDASIEFAIESTFGGAEQAIAGQQITFGRTRIRIDTPVAGTYTITHPYGTNEFVVVDPAEGINYTADIGSANFLNPVLGFRGTLAGTIGPFLTWENFDTNQALQVLELDAITGEPTGTVLEQYVGDPNIPSPVVGSPFNNNFFRVEGPANSNLGGLGNALVETNLFGVMGKVNDTVDDNNLYNYTNVEVPNLFAVGPVNRVTTLFPNSSAIAAGGNFSADYSLGYPHWYQENAGTVENPIGGLQLTLCPPGDAMCISAPIIPGNTVQNELMTGGEGFWYSAAASFAVGNDSYAIEFALESTFGGDEAMVDGNQIAFTRERIRFNFGDDKPAATYRVTHPYGVRILEPQPDRLDRVRFVADIGIANLADPDGAYVGALYGVIGPKFLTWNNFVDPSTLPAEQLGADYPVQDLVTVYDADAGLFSYHVGNPTIPHAITGGPNGNIFRVERLASGTVESGNWVTVGQTNLFAVSGKIYDPATFEFNINPDVPIAVADAATFNMLNDPPYIINVAGNDLVNEGFPVTVTVVTQPAFGTAVANNPAGTITYTPNANFSLAGGVDAFTYQISQTISDQVLTSSPTTVTVTIVPVETITVDRANFNTRNLRLDLRGASNFPGTTLTIHAGAAASGPVIGTVPVDDRGRWNFRGTATANLTSVTLVSNSAGSTTVIQPLQVR